MSSTFFASPTYPSWILVESEEDAAGRSFTVIHATQIVGNFNPNIRKVRYFRDGRQYPGIILVVSDHRRYVEQQRDRLLALEKTSKSGDLWGLVRIEHGKNKVRLTTLDGDRLRCCEDSKGRRRYLLEFGGHTVPVTLLHVLDSEKGLKDAMAYLKEKIFRNFGGKNSFESLFNLDQAYLLVQYYEDSSNLVFTIVRYRDTVWKDRNRFPMVVAYIAHGDCSCQSIILRMSYDCNELLELLDEIRDTCDRLDYLTLQARLSNSESSSGNLYSRPPQSR